MTINGSSPSVSPRQTNESSGRNHLINDNSQRPGINDPSRSIIGNSSGAMGKHGHAHSSGSSSSSHINSASPAGLANANYNPSLSHQQQVPFSIYLLSFKNFNFIIRISSTLINNVIVFYFRVLLLTHYLT